MCRAYTWQERNISKQKQLLILETSCPQMTIGDTSTPSLSQNVRAVTQFQVQKITVCVPALLHSYGKLPIQGSQPDGLMNYQILGKISRRAFYTQLSLSLSL